MYVDLYAELARTCPCNEYTQSVREPLELPTLAIFACGTGTRDPIKNRKIRMGLGILLQVENRRQPILVLQHHTKSKPQSKQSYDVGGSGGGEDESGNKKRTKKPVCCAEISHVGQVYHTVSNVITALSDLSPRNGWSYTMVGRHATLIDEYRTKAGGPGFHAQPSRTNLCWLARVWHKYICNTEYNAAHASDMRALYAPLTDAPAENGQMEYEYGVALYNKLLSLEVTLPDKIARTRIQMHPKQSSHVPRPRETRLDGQALLRGKHVRHMHSVTVDRNGHVLLYVHTECGRGWITLDALARMAPEWLGKAMTKIVDLLMSREPCMCNMLYADNESHVKCTALDGLTGAAPSHAAATTTHHSEHEQQDVVAVVVARNDEHADMERKNDKNMKKNNTDDDEQMLMVDELVASSLGERGRGRRMQRSNNTKKTTASTRKRATLFNKKLEQAVLGPSMSSSLSSSALEQQQEPPKKRRRRHEPMAMITQEAAVVGGE